MSDTTTPIIILTKDFKIEGDIDLIPGARMTDFMNNAKTFIAVTNAVVMDHEGKVLLRGQFINVFMNSIEVILPTENLLESS